MLTVENLSVAYERRGQVIPAVRNLSLSIKPGETVGLVGESGSGKSTVALAILRLIRPQEGRILSGRILLNGEDLLALPEARMRAIRGRRISMIFQDPFTSLNPVMRIREQMKEMMGPPPTTAGDDEFATAGDDELVNALKRVQLEPVRTLGSYPHQLSGGQRQRVMIAMALLGKPDFILADEPTTALDVLVQKDILELLFTLQRDLGMGMLFITHNLGLIAQHAQRIAVMKDGTLVEENVPEQLFRAPKQAYTRQLIQSVFTL